MDYRTAYGELLSALFVYEKKAGDALVELMKDVRRIENNLNKTLPPIQFVPEPDEPDTKK